MTRTTVTRLLTWSFVFSVAFVGFWWLVWWLSSGQVKSLINDMSAVFKPAFAVAVFLSGNPHIVNGYIWFAAQVVQCFFVVLVIAWVVVFTRRHTQRGTDRV